jgi:hypothetical protein
MLGSYSAVSRGVAASYTGEQSTRDIPDCKSKRLSLAQGACQSGNAPGAMDIQPIHGARLAVKSESHSGARSGCWRRSPAAPDGDLFVPCVVALILKNACVTTEPA